MERKPVGLGRRVQAGDAVTARERFEQAYGEDNEMTEAQVRAQRLSNGSYRLPKMANAWYWWQRGQEAA